MGRGKLPMELIPHEKSRCSTFHKRKRGLMKKLEEFTTLCDVQACMIVYGPQHDDGRPMELDVWPPEHSKVEKVIKRYQMKGPDEKPRQIQDLQFFFEKRKEKVNEDIVKMRRANTKAKYPGWDDHSIYYASVEQLYQILEMVDNRIYRAGAYYESLKENQRALMMKNGALTLMAAQNNNMQGYQQLPLMGNHMLDTQSCFPMYDFNNSMPQNPTMMMINDEYQYAGSSSISHNYQSKAPPMFYDQNTGFLDNRLMHSNNHSNMIPPLMYYSPPSTQQQQQQQQQEVEHQQRQIINMNNNLLLMGSSNCPQ